MTNTITLFADDTAIPFDRFHFPGGESHIRIPSCTPTAWTIRMDYRGDSDLITTALLCDAIRQQSNAPIDLVMPYTPYARQDRAAARGDAFSMRVIGDIIKGLPLRQCTVWDIHSEAALACLPANTRNIEASTFLGPYLTGQECIIAPDHGAIERARRCARTPDQPVVFATKQRDPETGMLSHPEIPDNLPTDRPIVVVDDICDGGRTFIQLAEALRTRTTQPLHLYVTHGIFSQGVDTLLRHYTTILTPNPFPTALPPTVRILPE